MTTLHILTAGPNGSTVVLNDVDPAEFFAPPRQRHPGQADPILERVRARMADWPACPAAQSRRVRTDTVRALFAEAERAAWRKL